MISMIIEFINQIKNSPKYLLFYLFIYYSLTRYRNDIALQVQRIIHTGHSMRVMRDFYKKYTKTL